MLASDPARDDPSSVPAREDGAAANPWAILEIAPDAAPPPSDGYIDLVLDDDGPDGPRQGQQPPPAPASARARDAPPFVPAAPGAARRGVLAREVLAVLAAFVAFGSAVAAFAPRVHPAAPAAAANVAERAAAVPAALAPREEHRRVRRAAPRALRSSTAGFVEALPAPVFADPPDPPASCAGSTAAPQAEAAVIPPEPRAPEVAPAVVVEPRTPVTATAIDSRAPEAAPAAPAIAPAPVPAPAAPPDAPATMPAATTASEGHRKPRLADPACVAAALARTGHVPAPGERTKLRVDVAAEGAAVGVELLAGALDRDAGDAVRQAVAGCRFAPATDAEGRAVRAWHVLELEFVRRAPP